MLDLQHVLGCLSNVLADAMSVQRAEHQGAENQQIEGARENRGA
jgi:hypothetical protein